jgi:transposase
MSRTLAKKLAQVKPGTLFVGVDLGLDRNVAVIINGGAKRLAKFSFPHDQDGYAYFRQRLKKLQEQHQAAALLVGMEPSNYFWKLLATELERHQLAYRLVNPYTVKKHREGDQLDRSKDDVRDAFAIADLLRTGKFTETQLLHGPYAELRQYATLYERLRCEIVRQKNRLHSAVGQLFPELTRVFKDLSGLTARAMLTTMLPLRSSAICLRRTWSPLCGLILKASACMYPSCVMPMVSLPPRWACRMASRLCN